MEATEELEAEEIGRKLKFSNAIISFLVAILLMMVNPSEIFYLFDPFLSAVLIAIPVLFIVGVLLERREIYMTSVSAALLVVSISILLEGSTLLRPVAFIILLTGVGMLISIFQTGEKD